MKKTKNLFVAVVLLFGFNAYANEPQAIDFEANTVEQPQVSKVEPDQHCKYTYESTCEEVEEPAVEKIEDNTPALAFLKFVNTYFKFAFDRAEKATVNVHSEQDSEQAVQTIADQLINHDRILEIIYEFEIIYEMVKALSL